MSAPHTKAPDWLILTIACVAQFMVVLDVSIVNIALPYIQPALHFSMSSIQWVVNAYVITFAGFLLLGGRAADLFGRRRIYLLGLTIFTVASLGAGFAATAGQMVAIRAIQGFGGAILSPATLTIIVTTFHGPKLPRAIGVWSAVAGGGGAVGVLLGGLLVGGPGWQWIFFINVPVGAAAGVIAWKYLHELRNRNELVKLDYTGALLGTAGLAGIVYGFINTDSHAWGSTSTLSWFAGGIVALVAFVFWEIEVASHPLLPFRIFAHRALTGANVVMLLIGAAFFSMWYFLTFYIHDVLGFSAVLTGLAFAPMSAAIIIGAQLSSRLISRAGVRPIIFTACVMTAVGFWWMSLITVHSSYAVNLLTPAVIVSFGMGLLFTPLATSATSHIDRKDAGLASGVLNTARQVGGSLGLAVLATIATHREEEFPTRHHHVTLLAQTAGYQRAFLVATGIFVLALAGSVLIPARTGKSVEATAAAGAAH